MQTEQEAIEFDDTRETALTPSPIAGAPVGADPIKWLETRVEVANRAVPVMIKRTIPNDWVRHKSDRGETFYLQSTGVDRLAPIAGLNFGVPKVERVQLEDAHVKFRVTGDVACNLYGIELRGMEGARSSKDPFFANQKAGWDEEDVRKAAYNNWRARGASMILGLRGLTAKALTDAGFNVSEIPGVEYKGKDSAAPSAEKSAANGDTISEPQGKRLWAIANARSEKIGGIDPKKIIRDSMDECGYRGVESSKAIKRADYDTIVRYVEQYEALP